IDEVVDELFYINRSRVAFGGSDGEMALAVNLEVSCSPILHTISLKELFQCDVFYLSNPPQVFPRPSVAHPPSTSPPGRQPPIPRKVFPRPSVADPPSTSRRGRHQPIPGIAPPNVALANIALQTPAIPSLVRFPPPAVLPAPPPTDGLPEFALQNCSPRNYFH